MASYTDHIERTFGHYIISWKISNFCLATCKPGWEIQSSELYVNGPPPTKWKMSLRPRLIESGSDCITLFLKRLEPDGPKVVVVNWESSLLDCKGYEISKTESWYHFEKDTAFGVDLQCMNFVLHKILPFNPDILEVKCQLMVRDDEIIRKWKTPNDISLRSLSQDLRSLFKFSNFSDIVFKMDDVEIRAHKSIIHSRNHVLADLLNSFRGKNIIPFEADYKAMEMVISYLYTGNLEFVLANPTIAIHKCALLLDIEEIKNYYNADKVVTHTEVDAQEFSFIWLVKDFRSRYETCIVSPIMTKGIADVSWRFFLYPKGIGHDATYISILSEIVEGGRPMNVCLEFGLMGANQQLYCLNRTRTSFEVPKALGIYDFVRRDSLESDTLLTDDELRVVIKIRMSNRTQINRIGRKEFRKFISSKSKTSYDSLSSDLTGMYEKGKFRDITLLAEGKQFKVHKCILAARSRVFMGEFNKLRKSAAVMNIPNTKPNILRIALNYMYSGVIRDLNLEDLEEVYKLAERFEIPSLKHYCMQIFYKNPVMETVCDILKFAEDKKEREPRSPCTKPICYDVSADFKISWKSLSMARAALYLDISGCGQKLQ